MPPREARKWSVQLCGCKTLGLYHVGFEKGDSDQSGLVNRDSSILSSACRVLVVVYVTHLKSHSFPTKQALDVDMIMAKDRCTMKVSFKKSGEILASDEQELPRIMQTGFDAEFNPHCQAALIAGPRHPRRRFEFPIGAHAGETGCRETRSKHRAFLIQGTSPSRPEKSIPMPECLEYPL